MERQHALRLRALVRKAAESLSDEDALDGVEMFPFWEIGVEYSLNFRVRNSFDNKLYKCVQSHTSQEGWRPDLTPALWTEVAKPGEIPVWRQPSGAQDAYMIGDKVHYPEITDPVYESLIDYNVYSPEAYPAGWKLVE